MHQIQSHNQGAADLAKLKSRPRKELWNSGTSITHSQILCSFQIYTLSILSQLNAHNSFTFSLNLHFIFPALTMKMYPVLHFVIQFLQFLLMHSWKWFTRAIWFHRDLSHMRGFFCHCSPSSLHIGQLQSCWVLVQLYFTTRAVSLSHIWKVFPKITIAT
jgi:hypothetical protein